MLTSDWLTCGHVTADFLIRLVQMFNKTEALRMECKVYINVLLQICDGSHRNGVHRCCMEDKIVVKVKFIGNRNGCL